MMSFLHDLHLAARRLTQQIGTTLIAVLALALGIGFTATMFSIVRGTLLRDLPFDEADRLVSVGSRDLDAGGTRIRLHDYHDWQERQTSFEGLAAHQTFG